MTQDFLQFARPDLTDAEIDAVVESLRSGWLTYGPRSQAFEEAFRKAAGSEHAVAVTSCTAALHLALIAAGIGPGDEVITTPLTFAATANVIVHAGATPVLADIAADDMEIDPAAVARKITARTRAILPVHYAGQPCRMDELLAVARPNGIRVIEDAAHAAGATYKGRPAGALGDAAAFSFYAIKNMTTGEGGMLTTNDAELADKVRVLRAHGLSADAWKRYSATGTATYDVTLPGFNYRLTDFQAALGLVQLGRLEAMNAERTALAERYNRGLAPVEAVETPFIRPEVKTNWHLYPLRLRLERLTISRDEFVQALKERGIQTSLHYMPLHYYTYYREGFGFQRGDYPVAEETYERLISLPLYPTMTEADVDRVVAAVEAIGGEHRR